MAPSGPGMQAQGRQLTEKFKVIKFLGKGSYGSVYLVQRLSDGRNYALKEMDVRAMSQSERQDSANEVRLLASVAHPNVIGYHEAFLDGKEHLCIIMEYAPDGDLAKLIKKWQFLKRPMPEDLIWKLVIQLAGGLSALHALRILHRDIKPGNVMVSEDEVVKIGDLGIAKLLKSTMAKTQIGTPSYMPPEIWRSRPYSFSSDAWALGCVIYEMATYRVPFPAKSMQELRTKVMLGSYAPITGYSRELTQLVSSLLQQEADKRPSMAAILSSPAVAARIHLLPPSLTGMPAVPVSARSNILDTIVVPKNIAQLKGRLPPAQYRREEDMELDAIEEERSSASAFALQPQPSKPRLPVMQPSQPQPQPQHLQPVPPAQPPPQQHRVPVLKQIPSNRLRVPLPPMPQQASAAAAAAAVAQQQAEIMALEQQLAELKQRQLQEEQQQRQQQELQQRQQQRQQQQQQQQPQWQQQQEYQQRRELGPAVRQSQQQLHVHAPAEVLELPTPSYGGFDEAEDSPNSILPSPIHHRAPAAAIPAPRHSYPPPVLPNPLAPPQATHSAYPPSTASVYGVRASHDSAPTGVSESRASYGAFYHNAPSTALAPTRILAPSAVAQALPVYQEQQHDLHRLPSYQQAPRQPLWEQQLQQQLAQPPTYVHQQQQPQHQLPAHWQQQQQQGRYPSGSGARVSSGQQAAQPSILLPGPRGPAAGGGIGRKGVPAAPRRSSIDAGYMPLGHGGGPSMVPASQLAAAHGYRLPAIAPQSGGGGVSYLQQQEQYARKAASVVSGMSRVSNGGGTRAAKAQAPPWALSNDRMSRWRS